MNNFSSEEKHMELISTTFQNMFPSININKVRLKEIRRILLLNYNEEDDTIDLRHYTVTYRPVGVSRNMKKLLANNHGKLPNLGRCQDIAEFLDKEGEASESEGEDMSETVDLGQRLSARGTKGIDEVAIRLVELGPRMKLQLIKIEEGLLDGEVLYHKYVAKSDEEKLALRKLRAEKRNTRESRRKLQQKNVERKREEKEKHKERCLAGLKAKFKSYPKNEQNDDYDDDAEWYRKEVGEEPEDMQIG
jgi:ribosome biogenesis protein SSF1/2